ncbi:MAG: PAS domain-containing protein [Bacteroidota bacterium]
MNPKITATIPSAQAIAALLHPHGEVVLHDLKTGKIAALFNNFSKRSVGDDSLLEEDLDLKALPDYFGPYTKINWDGRKLKSVSSTIRDESGDAVGLFCINLDVSFIENIGKQLLQFSNHQDETPLPVQLFADDWREKINSFVQQYLRSNHIGLQSATRDQLKEIVIKLHKNGAFKAKKAADYVASVLNISRATVYIYLRE